MPDGARFCAACGSAVSSSDAPTMVQRPESPSSSGSLKHGRFLPGTILGSRFRIVAMLGRGGMGEVFRADDLKLGQPVALKFLPRAVARDEKRLARLYSEVRVARQIAHPNVCRVYDIGEVDGEHFISMEYIEGEDLSTLLRRIGRLPEAKAVQMARQIAAGVAAAHERGILHRDLKPANIMLDERGLVRITDFGLAAIASEVGDTNVAEGTPAYMAPEQLAGEQVSPRSDLYSVGLVLYEIFTGKRAFDAQNTADLLHQRHISSTPSAPSSIAPDLNPAIERVILRCIETDPQNRPTSAAMIAAALPGADPFAAAIAAGETPSPELLAAAGDLGGMKPSRAIACLVALLLGLGLIVVASQKYSVASYIQAPRPADELAARARDVAKRLGYRPQPFHAYGFIFMDDYFRHVKQKDNRIDRWERLRKSPPTALAFWYRESPRPLVPENLFAFGRPSPDDPPERTTGMYTIGLDPDGRLFKMSAATPQQSDAGTPRPVDWKPLFEFAELDPAKFQPGTSKWTAATWGDSRTAWSGKSPSQVDVPLRLEAAAYAGKIIYFDVLAPWDQPSRDVPPQMTAAEKIAGIIAIIVLVAILTAAALLARRNFRLGRGDRRGAFRVAFGIFSILVITLLLNANHVASPAEIGLLLPGISAALLLAAISWLLYVALEPYARRRWPKTLVSWSRLLSGQWRDPLVGRDVLVGVTTGVVMTAIAAWAIAIAGRYTAPEQPELFDTDVLLGLRTLIASITIRIPLVFAAGIANYIFLFLLRIIARRDLFAATLFVLINGAMTAVAADNHWLGLILGISGGTVGMVLLLRFGLLAIIAESFVALVVGRLPVAEDLSSPYLLITIFGLIAVTGLALYAFRVALAGKPILSEALLET